MINPHQENTSSYATLTEESYYKKLWTSENYGVAEPNYDESLRKEKIFDLINDILKSMPMINGKRRILDLGCGRGWLANQLVNFGDVVGIDPVCEGVQIANKMFPKLDIRCSDAKTLLELEGENSFSLIVSTEVIEHIPDDKKLDLLSLTYKLLSPNGYAIITTPRKERWLEWKANGGDEQPIEQWLSERELDEMCKVAGFEIVKRDRIALSYLHFTLVSNVMKIRVIRKILRMKICRRVLEKINYENGFYQIILIRRTV